MDIIIIISIVPTGESPRPPTEMRTAVGRHDHRQHRRSHLRQPWSKPPAITHGSRTSPALVSSSGSGLCGASQIGGSRRLPRHDPATDRIEPEGDERGRMVTPSSRTVHRRPDRTQAFPTVAAPAVCPAQPRKSWVATACAYAKPNQPLNRRIGAGECSE
ncbi:hypothetical protein NUW54_g8470 [Trametes sanguinea]|uniref:Uncharacterized protein n=1 Tax=Trametes sanguinea TaxID=158606 RepID=A0ACC1PFX3_9APHY|nr:hypothetical protein NUW54_g8470 [Trametes sanguinea]